MRKLLLFILVFFCSAAYATDETTQFLKESSTFQREEVSPWSSTLSIDGQNFYVNLDKESLELAIFYAINQQKWHKVKEFTSVYRQLDGYQEALVLMAEGLLARQQGEMGEAVEKLVQAQQLAPQDTRILLELGRAYTENYDNQTAQKYFNYVLNMPIPTPVKDRVKAYLSYIEKRQNWKGLLSVGYGYNSNINQANGAVLCAFSIADICLLEQRLEQPHASNFYQYQLSLSKTIDLKGHHKLVINPIIYGSQYQQKANDTIKNYNDNTSILSVNYLYQTGKNSFTIGPTLEHYYRGNHPFYWGLGIESEWTYMLSSRFKLNTQLSAKRYHLKDKVNYKDYTQYSTSIGLQYWITSSLQAYAGYDYIRRKYDSAILSSITHGARVSLFKVFDNDAYINLMAFYRDSRYGARTFLANDKPRHDSQKIFMAAVGIPKWNIKNIFPEVRYKRVMSKSNVLFYNYAQHEISFNLKYIF